MNGRTRVSGQAKLTIPISGEIKLSLSGIGSAIDYRDYSHDWFLLPDGDVKKYDVVRVMCSGRVDPTFVVKAFQSGADGVLVCG